jgi:MarR family transcriptional repressor of emrRAB
MNNTGRPDLEIVEASLARLASRIPDTPMPGIMLTRLLLHVGRGMASILEQEVRRFGLAEPEFRVLTTLFSQPDGVAHPTELCRMTSQSPANMSRISDALVSRELITRVLSSQDRRRMVLGITERGNDLVRRLLPLLFVPVRAMLENFSHSEQLELVSKLKRLGMTLDELTLRSVDQPRD